MKKLYLKISLTLFGILTALGVFYIVLTCYMAEEYLQETKQQVHGNLASDIMTGVRPLLKEGVKESMVEHIMHFIITINPDVDVYLLKPDGEICTNISKEKKLEVKRIDLTPIKAFIAAEKKPYIKGIDPKNTKEQKVFSAAKMVNEENEHLGYVYVVLDNKKSAEVVSDLMGSYITTLGIRAFVLALLLALIIGVIAVWFLTKNLRSYLQTVTKFKNGNYNIRVAEKAKGDFPVLGETFNLMADEIESSIEKIKSVDEFRKELIANVSHDLRTPVMVIQGYAETLMMKKGKISNQNIEEYLNVIIKGTCKLSTLINQLFEYSKLEAKEIKPQMEYFDFRDLIHDTAANYQIIANKKGIGLDIELDEKLPMAFADIGLTERVLQNLMDNAIKFTPPEGQITIGVKNIKKNIQIEIHNTGAPIPTDKLPYIFDRYQKTDKTFVKRNNGAGLGLAIVKKILDLHQSDISVVSEKGRGTTFTFEIPKTNLRKMKKELALAI